MSPEAKQDRPDPPRPAAISARPGSDSASGPLLETLWEKRAVRGAWIFSGLGLVGFTFFGLAAGKPLWATLPVAALLALGVYFFQTRKIRRRREILREPFPVEWEAVLQREVIFYRALEPEERRRFRRELQVFLGEKRITGIKTEVDDTTLVLAAASAIIPIFGFPEWEWDQISEILIYPSRFSEDFAFGDRGDHHTLGMVGSGPMSRVMILAKPDLIHGFRNAVDKRNVGLHEFAHLVDRSDGAIDGLPAVGLERRAIGPWIELVRREMEAIEQGDSDIDRYALTNEAEFFAVATEYFFERPRLMQEKHPALYSALSRVFHQDLRTRAAAMARERRRGRPRFGRNSPCPCGSGRKYKKCCLRHARRGTQARRSPYSAAGSK